MGWAKIKINVKAGRFNKSSEAVTSAFEQNLHKAGELFVEDCTADTTIIRWGCDLTAEEKREMAMAAEADRPVKSQRKVTGRKVGGR